MAFAVLINRKNWLSWQAIFGVVMGERALLQTVHATVSGRDPNRALSIFINSTDAETRKAFMDRIGGDVVIFDAVESGCIRTPECTGLHSITTSINRNSRMSRVREKLVMLPPHKAAGGEDQERAWLFSPNAENLVMRQTVLRRVRSK